MLWTASESALEHVLGKKHWLCLPRITGEFLVCFSVSFLICHRGMWWVQPLQAGPGTANSWDFTKIFSHGGSAGLDLFSAVVLYWRSRCSSFNQLKGKVVTSASNGFLSFLRIPGIGFCSGVDIQKLGFRLAFLQTGAVGSVHLVW